MKYSLRLGILAWLICSHFLFAQSGSPLTQQKPEPSTSSSNQEPNQPIVVKGDGGCHLGQKPTAEMGPLEILTDTTGVDFSTVSDARPTQCQRELVQRHSGNSEGAQKKERYCQGLSLPFLKMARSRE